MGMKTNQRESKGNQKHMEIKGKQMEKINIKWKAKERKWETAKIA